MRIDFLTLFPDMCETVMAESIIGRARKKGALQVCCHDLRAFGRGKHQQVDDTPFGGGKGMLMMAEPIAKCIDSLTAHLGKKPYVIYLSPLGQVLNQQQVFALADLPSKEQLLAQVVGTIAAPLRGLVTVLSGPQRNFVTVLSQIKDKKEETAA